MQWLRWPILVEKCWETFPEVIKSGFYGNKFFFIFSFSKYFWRRKSCFPDDLIMDYVSTIHIGAYYPVFIQFPYLLVSPHLWFFHQIFLSIFLQNLSISLQKFSIFTIPHPKSGEKHTCSSYTWDTPNFSGNGSSYDINANFTVIMIFHQIQYPVIEWERFEQIVNNESNVILGIQHKHLRSIVYLQIF